MFVFLLSHLPSPHKSSFVRDFSSIVRMHKSMSFNEFIHETFTKVCEVLAAQKSWKVDSASNLQE